MKMSRLILATLLLALATAVQADGVPLATGQSKFLGSAYSPSQAKGFTDYWNKVSPENAGKWGEVEAVRGQMNWTALDKAYHFAKSHGYPFHMHVMVWGNQQPEWIKHLPPTEQLRAIKHWFAAVSERYPDLDYVEVVNEALNDPPSKDDEGGGNYINALGGSGETGWDWIVESFRLGRHYFPHAKLLINDYNVINKAENTAAYRKIIDILNRDHLVDGIGVQAHAFETVGIPAATLRANLDTLAATGLPIYITEMDIDGPTDAAQLKEYQRVFPVFWDDPAVKGITMWGFRPGLWREKERAYLVDRHGRERPAMLWLRGYVRGVTGPAK